MSASRNDFASAQFVRFVLVGGIAALVNFLSRIAFNYFSSYPVAIVLAYFVGIATAYVLSRQFVFGATGKGPVREIAWFVIVNLFGLLQTLVVSIALAWYALPALGVERHSEEVAHLIGVCVPVFTSYLGHKYFTFR